MKIECSKEKLQAAITQASRVAGKNTNLPVLGCLLLDATKQGLLIRATNLELGIEVRVPVKVVKEGVVAIPADAIAQLASNLYGGGSVSLELKDGHLSVAAGKSRALIKAVPHEDFPTLPKPSDTSFQIKTSNFAEGLRSVWYCASAASVKPELSSVLLQAGNDTLTFVATDSFRLGEKKIFLKGLPECDSMLIPLRNVPEIIKALDAHGGEATVCFGKHQLSFLLGETYLTSRLIEGSFPDYRQIIPKKSTTEAVLLKQDLANAFKLANIFSDQFHQVKLTLSPVKKSFAISSRSADIGESENSLDAALSGEEVSLGFNYRYIADCFQSIHSDSVKLQFSGVGKALLVSGISDPSFVYLVMPMNR